MPKFSSAFSYSRVFEINKYIGTGEIKKSMCGIVFINLKKKERKKKVNAGRHARTKFFYKPKLVRQRIAYPGFWKTIYSDFFKSRKRA